MIIIGTLTNDRVGDRFLFQLCRLRLNIIYNDSFLCYTDAIHSEDALEKEEKRFNNNLSTGLLPANLRECEMRKDYFLNFSSLTETPEGHGSFSRSSRHRARDAQIFFRGLVSAHIPSRGATARWAVALKARPRNNLYEKCVREWEREGGRDLSSWGALCLNLN